MVTRCLIPECGESAKLIPHSGTRHLVQLQLNLRSTKGSFSKSSRIAGALKSVIMKFSTNTNRELIRQSREVTGNRENEL